MGWSMSRGRAAADDHRCAGRGGGRPDPGNHAQRRDALVDAVDGREVGLTQNAILRIWRAYGLQPHPAEMFKLSKDPQFVDKIHDIVGLYLNPPERAVVLCVDEKSQIQALDRTQPILPLLPAVPERRSHDYRRAGTSSLYAALDLATGKVSDACTPPPRDRVQEVPAGHRPRGPRPPRRAPRARQQLHAQDADDQALARRAPTVHAGLHPTSSSWANLVERWFAELTTKPLQRGAHPSVHALNADIRAWIETGTTTPALRLDQDRRPDPRLDRPLHQPNQSITTLGPERRSAMRITQGTFSYLPDPDRCSDRGPAALRPAPGLGDHGRAHRRPAPAQRAVGDDAGAAAVRPHRGRRRRRHGRDPRGARGVAARLT